MQKEPANYCTNCVTEGSGDYSGAKCVNWINDNEWRIWEFSTYRILWRQEESNELPTWHVCATGWRNMYREIKFIKQEVLLRARKESNKWRAVISYVLKGWHVVSDNLISLILHVLSHIRYISRSFKGKIVLINTVVSYSHGLTEHFRPNSC